MTAELIYRTQDPVVLQWWEEKEKAREAYAERLKEYREKLKGIFGNERNVMANFHMGGIRLTGVIVERNEWNREAPPGWRIDKKSREWRPALKTPEGKEVARQMSNVGLRAWVGDSIKFGVPQIIHSEMTDGEGYMYFPHLEMINGWVYLTYGSSHEEDMVWESLTKSKVEWEEVTRREYRDLMKKEKFDA